MRGSEWLGRMALVLLGLVLAAAALEILLQLGAAVLRATGDAPARFGSAGTRILCLGDSNTYGVWLADRETEAWPPQLEALWNEAEPERPIEVLNAGYPGTSSSHLLRDFAELLDAFQPDLVVVLIGVNDFWTEPVAVAEARDGLWGFIRRHSRVLRLTRLLRPRIDASELEVRRESAEPRKRAAGVVRFGDHIFDRGWRRAESRRRVAGEGLARNLRRMAERSRALGVPLLLLTYPSDRSFYAHANATIRRAAEEAGIPLVDLEAFFRRLCPEGNCSGWLYPDSHPRARGHVLVAEMIANRLREDAP